MFQRLPELMMALALACSLSLHWGSFQSVASMGMVIRHSPDGPLTEALAKTFDASHRWPLRKEFAKGKPSEKKSEFAPAMTSVFLGPQISFKWSSRLSALIGADLPVSIVSSGKHLAPSYRLRAAVAWRF